MAASFSRFLFAEWLKFRRSAAMWLMLAGALFIPVIKLIESFTRSERFASHTSHVLFWQGHQHECWQLMSLSLLPLGIIFIVSLLFQTEHSQGGWRQMHWQPIPQSLVFGGKLMLVLLLAVAFWLIFSAGIWISAMLPAALIEQAQLPQGNLFTAAYFARSGKLMLAALPVMALQFVLSMSIRNFLVPVGIGIVLYVSALIALQWEYGAFLPYTWPALEFLQKQVAAAQYYPLRWLPYVFSAGFLLCGFAWYKWKPIKD